jgi:hypothetical protein
LTSSPIFSRTDTVTDSETFYSSILDLFDDVEEQGEVKDLIAWWNRYVPPPFINAFDPRLALLRLQSNFPQLFGRTAAHHHRQCLG